MASGGSGDYLYTWTSVPSGFSSDIPDPIVSPSVNTTYTVAIDDGYSTVNGNTAVTVNSLPVPEAGPDKTIPFGTSTSIQGSASSGSGNYSYHWEPADKLVNPYNPQPTTVLLSETTLFSLTVTDVQTGCVCDQPDYMTVVITGNALNVNPVAEPDTICSGEPVHLYSLAGGGSGIYEYYWTSNPAGLSDTAKNPVVQPLVTTTYSVSLTDGYTYVNGSTSVVVNQTPLIALGADATSCVFDTLTLDAGNPGSTYLWSNGTTLRTLRIYTTGIGFDMRTVSVTVTSPEGCTATDQRTITFDFAACNGIDDPVAESGFHIYPNPGSGVIHIDNDKNIGNCLLNITDIFGREIVKNQVIIFSDTDKTFNLNLESYPPGLYLIRISAGGIDLVAMKYLLNR
jgi:hypothetical protein